MIKHNMWIFRVSTLFKLQENTQTAKNEFYVFESCFRMLAVILFQSFLFFLYFEKQQQQTYIKIKIK